MPDRMIRKQIHVGEALAARVKRLARRRRVSESELYRQAIEELLRDHEGATEDPFAPLVGCYQGAPDESENHDRYLYGDARPPR